MTGRAPFPRTTAIAGLLLALALAPGAVDAHGSLATGEGHDDPTLGELLLTPLVVAIIHLVAMVVLLALAYRSRGTGGADGEGEVPDRALEVFGPFIRDEDTIQRAFRPNRRMYIVSKNLPHFFVLTGLAVFFSVYTYKWLGDLTVFVYTTVHATAIVLLFAHSALAWRNTWYGLSGRALYSSFGSLSPLAVRMPLDGLRDISVRSSRLRGLLDVSSLRLTFRSPHVGKGRTELRMTAVDSPDRIREVILREADRLRTAT